MSPRLRRTFTASLSESESKSFDLLLDKKSPQPLSSSSPQKLITPWEQPGVLNSGTVFDPTGRCGDSDDFLSFSPLVSLPFISPNPFKRVLAASSSDSDQHSPSPSFGWNAAGSWWCSFRRLVTVSSSSWVSWTTSSFGRAEGWRLSIFRARLPSSLTGWGPDLNGSGRTGGAWQADIRGGGVLSRKQSKTWWWHCKGHLNTQNFFSSWVSFQI